MEKAVILLLSKLLWQNKAKNAPLRIPFYMIVVLFIYLLGPLFVPLNCYLQKLFDILIHIIRNLPFYIFLDRQDWHIIIFLTFKALA